MREASPSAIWCPTRCGKSSRAGNFTRSNPITSERLAHLCAEILADKKAEDLVALDMRRLASFTDFFVICSGNSEPHLKALVSELEDRLRKEHNIRPTRIDGFPLSQWVVADFSDVIVHVFHEEKRAYYSLEDLWADAPRLALAEHEPAR
ncbi:MAG: ribosome silencing factor [Chthoniobacteraceae bacterium]